MPDTIYIGAKSDSDFYLGQDVDALYLGANSYFDAPVGVDPKIMYPISTVRTFGTITGDHTDIDDVPFDDSDFIQFTESTNTPPIYLLNTVTDPGTDTGFIFRYRAGDSTGTALVYPRLFQGTTQIWAPSSETFSSGDPLETFDVAVPDSAIALITDWSNVGVGLRCLLGSNLKVTGVNLIIP